RVLGEEEIGEAQRAGFAKAEEAFRIRAGGIDWLSIDDSEGAFSRSPAALVEWAPVAPQLKEFDTEIVINSMRFKWKHVRDDLKQLITETAVLDSWRETGAAGEAAGQLAE
ncbi:MAG: hypothetical protein VW405_11445, partial [Rhodospirillaceae bacterium]